MSYFGVGKYVKGHYCNTVSKSIYLALYKDHAGRGFLVSLPSDILKYKELLDMKIEYQQLNKYDEDAMIREIERICNSDKSWDQLFEEAMPYEYIQSVSPQSYEEIEILSPERKFDYYESEKPRRALRQDISPSYSDVESAESVESDAESGSVSAEEEADEALSSIEETLRSYKFTPNPIGSRTAQVRQYELEDRELHRITLVEVEKLLSTLEGLSADKLTSVMKNARKIESNFINNVSGKIVKDKNYAEAYDFVLTRKLLKKMAEQIKEYVNSKSNMYGGYRRRHHRYTRCKKHTHCRYCGKRHH